MGSRLEIAKYTTIRNTLIKKSTGFFGNLSQHEWGVFPITKTSHHKNSP